MQAGSDIATDSNGVAIYLHCYSRSYGKKKNFMFELRKEQVGTYLIYTEVQD